MKSKLPLILVVLLAIGLLFGGAIHSSLHADDGHEGGDCQFCQLTPALQWEVVAVASRMALESVAPPPPGERVVVAEPRRDAAPRAPPG